MTRNVKSFKRRASVQWRIVIHRAIDGFSRLVTFLEASNINKSSTVMEKFVEAVEQYGVPRWREQCCLPFSWRFFKAQNLTGIQGVFDADEQPAQMDAELPHSSQVPAFNWPYSIEVPLTEYALDNDRLSELK
ncbi:hypothetical protein DPX16_3285 [Anabarilius grahami]|uniref:Integrase core domain-containing protein n=1 Tax=Anabarilius grahami TaxID=495550 RepID=A0A3N0XPK7_ANAGA|nr:hypothetical protein DPX16_3285 [Anabarilius grahami]